MGRNMEPVDVIEAKGRSHMTKAEKERRRASEVVPPEEMRGNVAPPGYLKRMKGLTARFNELAAQLSALTEHFCQADAECLARYVAAEHFYERYSVKLDRTVDPADIRNLQLAQDRAFRQAHACASALGLTVTSRCKLSVSKQEADDEDEF